MALPTQVAGAVSASAREPDPLVGARVQGAGANSARAAGTQTRTATSARAWHISGDQDNGCFVRKEAYSGHTALGLSREAQLLFQARG